MNPSDEDAIGTIINPYYAVSFSDYLFQEHKPEMAKEDWVLANADKIKDLEPQVWLTNLLATLAYERDNELADVISPYEAVILSEKLRGEHEATIDPADWVIANVKLVDEIGVEKWLWNLLDVLENS